jgi:hypothetical protein
MPKRKARFTWPPVGDERKQFHVEVAAPAAILQHLGADIEVGPPATKDAKGKIKPEAGSLREWLEGRDGSMGGLVQGGARSWNHPQLLMAARGLVLGDWGDALAVMEMQAGIRKPEGLACFLDGEEPRSSDYDPYRWACGIIFAEKGPGLLSFAARKVLGRQVAIQALGAVPWTDQGEEFRNAKGGLFYGGPTLSPVGERSPKTSNPDLNGLFCRLLGISAAKAREGWGNAVADILGCEPVADGAAIFRDPDLAVKMLGNALVFGTFNFWRYPEGLVVWRPNQLNPNTPSALWSFADFETLRQIRGFPFDPSEKNRGDGAPRSLGCSVEGGRLVARSTDERWTASLTLPTSPRLWTVTADEKGVRRS